MACAKASTPVAAEIFRGRFLIISGSSRTLSAIIASLNVSVREAFARSELGLMMKEYNTVREALNQQGVLMYSPWKVEVR